MTCPSLIGAVASSLSRYQLAVDAALCAHFAKEMKEHAVGPIWMWCDSSPQAGEECGVMTHEQCPQC